jgi:hypothetical protein
VTRLYTNPGFWVRNALLIVFLVAVFFYGCFELWRAYFHPSGDTSTGTLFGVVFAGGSLFALRQHFEDHRDLVATFDRDDETGRLAALIWQPLGGRQLMGEPAEFKNWRLHTKLGRRNARSFFIYVDVDGYPRPLRFDLKPGVNVDGLRAVTPETIAQFETAKVASA